MSSNSNEAVNGCILVMFMASVLAFVCPLVSCLFGAFSGFVVGLFFDTEILSTLMKFGIDTEGLKMWELGMTFGFIGGFFKSNIKTNSSNNN